MKDFRTPMLHPETMREIKVDDKKKKRGSGRGEAGKTPVLGNKTMKTRKNASKLTRPPVLHAESLSRKQGQGSGGETPGEGLGDRKAQVGNDERE